MSKLESNTAKLAEVLAKVNALPEADSGGADVPAVEQATPVITVSDAGLITATSTQEAGAVSAGTKSATKQLTTQAAKTVTPTTSEQTAVTAGVYTTGAVKVAAMPTATQATPSISVSGAGLITASATQSEGYVAAGTKNATKQLTTQAAKSVTPTTSDQTAVSGGVYTTGAVTVKGDANLKSANIAAGVSIFGVMGTHSGGADVSGVTAGAGDVLDGKKYVNSSGTLTSGTMPNNGAISKTMDGLDTKSVSIPAGYTSGGTVSLTGDIDNIANNQADKIAQIKTALEGKAAGGGGGSVETCTVTYFDGGCAVLGVYMSYVDGAYTPMVVWYPGVEEPGGTFTNVVKNSIFALYIGDYSMTETDGAELVIQEGDSFLAYHIQDNANIYVE